MNVPQCAREQPAQDVRQRRTFAGGRSGRSSTARLAGWSPSKLGVVGAVEGDPARCRQLSLDGASERWLLAGTCGNVSCMQRRIAAIAAVLMSLAVLPGTAHAVTRLASSGGGAAPPCTAAPCDLQ